MKKIVAVIVTVFITLSFAVPASADSIPSNGHLPNGFHFTAANSPYSVQDTLLVD